MKCKRPYRQAPYRAARLSKHPLPFESLCVYIRINKLSRTGRECQMTNRLKFFRVKNAKTQTEAAKAAGVTQPTYQRWETGKAPIPENYLKKLAKFFKTTGPELLGRHPPKEAAFYDDE